MKILLCPMNQPAPGTPGFPDALVMADSTLARNSEPLFVPDHILPSWKGVILPAVKISRLGLNVPAGAAASFLGEWTLVQVLVPATKDCGHPAGVAFLDRAVFPGRWIAAGDASEFPLTDAPLTVTLTDAGGNCSSCQWQGLRSAFEKAVIATSRPATLKMGDIIILRPPEFPSTSVIPDTRISATLSQDGYEPFNALSIKFK